VLSSTLSPYSLVVGVGGLSLEITSFLVKACGESSWLGVVKRK